VSLSELIKGDGVGFWKNKHKIEGEIGDRKALREKSAGLGIKSHEREKIETEAHVTTVHGTYLGGETKSDNL